MLDWELDRKAVFWLGLHLTAFVSRTELTLLGKSCLLPGWMSGEMWLWFRTALMTLLLGSLGLALLPLRFWRRWIGRSQRILFATALIGPATVLLGLQMQQGWRFVETATLAAVSIWIGAVGRPVVMSPAQGVVGTPDFHVTVGPGCSGLEGISLVCIILGLYFWFYRSDLRFPNVFLLLPIGVSLVWVLNSVRIALLILLGEKYPQIAIGGFHSVSGWIFLNVVVFGLIASTRRLSWFSRNNAPADQSNPAIVYLLPLFVVIAATMVCKALTSGVDSLYPARVVVAAVTFWFLRRQLFKLDWKMSVWAAAPGVLVFALWVALSPDAETYTNPFLRSGLAALSAPIAACWITLRVVGTVFMAPIVEELAFRGYLIRKLISSEFEKVPSGQFTWLSFAGSSALFGLLHGQWLPGVLAGMGFAGALYLRGRICDAVLAHATANALLAIYVLATHRWWLWS